MHYTGTVLFVCFLHQCVHIFFSFFFLSFLAALVMVMAPSPSCSLTDINQFYNRAQGLVGTSCLALNANIKLSLITLSPRARVLDIPSDFTQSLKIRRKVTQLSVQQHTYFNSSHWISSENGLNVWGFFTWVLRLVLALLVFNASHLFVWLFSW